MSDRKGEGRGEIQRPPDEYVAKTLEELAQDAVTYYNQAMYSGAYFLPNGEVIPLSPQDMTKVIQDLARRKGKTMRATSKVEDFQVHQTTKER